MVKRWGKVGGAGPVQWEADAADVRLRIRGGWLLSAYESGEADAALVSFERFCPPFY